MSLKYFVHVCDFGVQDMYMKTVRVRKFGNLAHARHYEKKLYNKAMRKPGVIGRVDRWGRSLRTFINGGNRSAVMKMFEIENAWGMMSCDLIRTITITCRAE